MPGHNPQQHEASRPDDFPDDPPAPVSWSLIGFVRCWSRTRHLALLFQGLPAVILAVVLASLLISRNKPVASETVDMYVRRAEESIAREELEQAEFYFRKLEMLAPDDPGVIEQRANLYAGQGKFLEAVRLRERLVNDDVPFGDSDHHKWLAKTALEQDLGLSSPLEYARQHLDAVLEDRPDDPEAHFFFARLHRLRGDLPNAIRHLEHISAYGTQFQLELAAHYLRLDPPNRVRANSNARNAATTLRQKVENQSSDINDYHQYAAANSILGDFDKAVETLRQAITRFDLDATRRQLARTYVAWSNQIREENPDEMSRRLALLEKALEAAPNEPAALQQMLQIASQEGEGAEQAEARLRQSLVDGEAPAAVHFSLGTLAAKRGDVETALRHFEQSKQLNPQTAVTLNNMAYIMLKVEDADLDQALELINQAIRMAPYAAPFRETRGQILIRLERWSEAIADLEFANSRMDDLDSRVAINESLVTAYRGLGDEQTAAAYEKKYKELAAQLAQSRPRQSVSPEFEFDAPAEETSQEPATP